MQWKNKLLAAPALLALALSGAHAQTPAPAQNAAPLYVVSYYEVLAPGQVAAGQATPLEIFERYKQAFARENGAVSVEVLADKGRANHFTLLEVWHDQDAYTRHTTSAAAQQLAKDVSPWLAGPKDERIYTKFE